jgi:hypothetical protein
MTLALRPVTLREARGFVDQHHRHNVPPRGWRFGVGVEADGALVGVAIASRPVARALDDGTTLEVIRTCTDGTRNANSMLYGAVARAGKALGYRRVVTYTVESESGSSLRAVGFEPVETLEPREGWSYSGQGRYTHDLFGEPRHAQGQRRIRWERSL